MSNYGIFTEPGTIQFERLLPGPIERVWTWLTDSEKRGRWLAFGEMDLRVGGKVELHFNHKHLTPHKEFIPEKYQQYGDESHMSGEIIRLDPPKLLSFTWGEEGMEKSEVTFELTPKGENVLLWLTHRRLEDDHEILRSVAAGWHTHLEILIDKLNDREPCPFWKEHIKKEQEYSDVIAGKL